MMGFTTRTQRESMRQPSYQRLTASQEMLFRDRVTERVSSGETFSAAVIETRREFYLPIGTPPYNVAAEHCDFCAAGTRA